MTTRDIDVNTQKYYLDVYELFNLFILYCCFYFCFFIVSFSHVERHTVLLRKCSVISIFSNACLYHLKLNKYYSEIYMISVILFCCQDSELHFEFGNVQTTGTQQELQLKAANQQYSEICTAVRKRHIFFYY